jgi:hypothetical protein
MEAQELGDFIANNYKFKKDFGEDCIPKKKKQNINLMIETGHVVIGNVVFKPVAIIPSLEGQEIQAKAHRLINERLIDV